MCLGDKPYQCSVSWDEHKNLVHFKFPLPSGTKEEDVKVEIDGDGTLLTVIRKMVEGDTTSPTIPMKFKMPLRLNTNGFKTAVDDEGLLTLTFKKLVPILSEPPFDLENVSMEWETAKENNKDVVHFKCPLPSGTKMEDMMVGIGGRNSLMIGIHGNNFRSFILPDDVIPNGFNNAMVDDAGVLTVTFTKLEPEKEKLESKMLGCLAQASPAACLVIFSNICDQVCDAICSGDCC